MIAVILAPGAKEVGLGDAALGTLCRDPWGSGAEFREVTFYAQASWAPKVSQRGPPAPQGRQRKAKVISRRVLGSSRFFKGTSCPASQGRQVASSGSYPNESKMRLKTFKGEQQITKPHTHKQNIRKLQIHRRTAAGYMASRSWHICFRLEHTLLPPLLSHNK